MVNGAYIPQRNFARSHRVVWKTSDADPGGDDDLKQVFETASAEGSGAVVTDSYLIGNRYIARLRAAGFYVVAIDDLARFPFPCQLVVNFGMHARQLSYQSSSGDTSFLLGPQYALLRPEFWHVDSRTIDDIVQNVLITIGGSDPHNLMPRMLASLDELSDKFTITAVIGPFFENRREIELSRDRCGRRVRLVDDPCLVRDHMLQADLAVSAGGETLYELAATGTPCVAFQVADNQSDNIQGMAAQGVLWSAGAVGDADLLDHVKTTTQRLIQSARTRLEMSKAGQLLIDGHGASRVVEMILRDFDSTLGAKETRTVPK
jgi:spore coat polysaccharide biosynthesis predicted glycosyltransferase SpsG